ncbi:MAG: hypothetical protein ACPGU1_07005 [Myxococcota bacterium]
MNTRLPRSVSILLAAFAVAVTGCGATSASVTTPSNDVSATTQRCSVTIHGPGNFSAAVPGWGATAGDATHAAHETARYLAEAHHMATGWIALFSDGGALPAADAGQVPSAWPSWLEAKPGDPIRLPGYRSSAVTCEPMDAPPAEGKRWLVTWAGLEAHGAELGATMERARRHACGRPFGDSRRAALEALGEAGRAEGLDAFRGALSKATGALQVCLTTEATVAFSLSPKAAAVSLSPAGPIVCVGALPDPSPTKQVRSRRDMRSYHTPTGVASSREGAREAAWRALRTVRHREGVAEALSALATASPTTVSMHLARAFELATEDVLPSMRMEKALTPCGPLPPAPATLAWSWTSSRPDRCPRSASGAAVEATSAGERGEDAIRSREAICSAQSWNQVTMISAAVAAADPASRARLFHAGWGDVLGCESRCVLDVSLDVALPLPADGFEDEASLWAALDKAIATKDIDGLLAAIPLFSLPKLMVGLRRDRARAFEGLAKALSDGSLRERMGATRLHGRYVALPRTTPPSK